MYYFAYGSNMNQDRMIERKMEFASLYKGILKDWKLVFNKKAYNKEGIGYANIVPSISSNVEGIIYKIEDEAIKYLDKAESYPKHYLKKDLFVELENGESLQCVAYIGNPLQIKEGLKPEKEYLGHLLKGQKLLSKGYFDFLMNIETKD